VDFKPEFNEARYREMLEPILPDPPLSPVHDAARNKDGHELTRGSHLQYMLPRRAPAVIAIAREFTERRKHEQMALRSQPVEPSHAGGGVAHDLTMRSRRSCGWKSENAVSRESNILDMFQTSAKRARTWCGSVELAKGAEGERIPSNRAPGEGDART